MGLVPTLASPRGEAALVGLRRFEGSADDSSASGNHGTFQNGTVLSNAAPAGIGSGQSLELDGSSRRLNFGYQRGGERHADQPLDRRNPGRHVDPHGGHR